MPSDSDRDRRPERILLVEDNPGDARLLEEYLSEAELIEAESDRESALEAALRRLGNGASPPDVVLLDLGLPDAGGLEAVEAIVEAAPVLPVVVLTGREDQRTAVEALRAGAEDYLLKGEIGPEVLARSIRYAVERTRATAKIRRQERRFRALITNLSDVISVIAPDGTVRYESPSVERVLGYEPEELEGENILEYIHPEDRSRIRGELGELGQEPRGETIGQARFRHADGSWRVLEARGRTPPDGTDIDGVIIVSRDVTERVERERELEQATTSLRERVKEQSCLYDVSQLLHADERPFGERLQSVVDRLPEGWQYPETTAARLRLNGSEWTSSGFRETEWSLSAPITVHGDRIGQIEVCYLEERPEEEIGPFLREEQTLLSAIADQIGIAADRHRTRRELEAERGRLREVFEAAPAWVATSRGEDHVFEMANPAYRDLIGNREIIGRTVREVLPDLEGEGYFELLDHVYQTGETVEVEEHLLPLETEEGGTEEKYITFVYQPRREDGDVVGLIAHGVDVTEQVVRRREAEEQRAKLDRILETSADGILLADADGDFTYANPAAEEMLGLEESEITARTFDDSKWELRGPDGGEFPDEELPVARVLRTGKPLKGVQFSVTRPDGTRRVLSGHHAPLDGPDGELQGVVASLRDVTEVRQARVALEHAKKMFRGVFDISPVALKVVDAATHEYRTVNEVFTEQFGYSREEVEGGDVRDQDLWTDARMRSRLYDRVAEGETVRNVEVTLRRKDGTGFEALFSASSLTVNGHRYVVGAVQDISYQKAVERELTRRTLHDNLTGLANRALLYDRLDHALERCQRTGESLAVCFVDLKRFKVINDSLGHEAGDRVLETVADRLRTAIRDQDTAARIGGDEFAVLLEDVDGEPGARTAADRIVRSFENPVGLGNRDVAVEASVGVAVHEADGTERPASTDLLQWAEEAMHQAKKRPGTARALADSTHPAPDITRIEREQRFRAALEAGEIDTVYQPVFGLQDGEVRGVETLARWHDPELGTVSPGEFIPMAEETGLIVQLGEQQLEEGCRSLLAEDAPGSAGTERPLRLQVNLSSHQLEDPEVVARVSGVLERTGFPAGRLCLEVTESAAAREPETVDRLGELGVRLAIDDFGTRYSTLAQLKRLRVNALKIDRSFVDGLPADDRDRAIVESVLTLGHALGLTVVAEGVESPEQMEVLRELGVDEVQGFHLARPMSMEELRTWMEERS